MSIKNTWYLPDSIGFVKYLDGIGDASNPVRNAAHKGGQIVSIQFKMPAYMIHSWFNIIEHDRFNRSNITHTTDCWIPNINNQSEYIKSVNKSICTYYELIDSGVTSEDAYGVLPQCIYVEFTETGSIEDYMRLCEENRGNISHIKGINMYFDLINSLIEEGQLGQKDNIKIAMNKLSDNPAEYQWGC